jgi:hypothetical protein
VVEETPFVAIDMSSYSLLKYFVLITVLGLLDCQMMETIT